MLLIEHPLISEWDWEINNQFGIDGNTIKTGSNKRDVWWSGKCGHKWSNMSPAQRYYQNHGCPYCSGHRILSGFNDLRTINPKLASEWDYNLNDDIPENVNPFSHSKAWWICGICGKSYEAQIKSRHLRGSNCKDCGKQKQANTLVKNRINKVGSLVDKFPTIAQEWDYNKNAKTPADYAPHSNAVCHWICNVCENHYEMSIVRRTSQKQGCPICGKIKSKIGRNKTHQNTSKSLYDRFPEIAIEWDFTKNQTTPNNVSAYSNKYAHWVCSKCGHHWEAVISSRTSQKNGCPRCSSSRGEKRIEQYLNAKGISYIKEYKFTDCKNQRLLPFDFYIPTLNIAIEYDGKQHFEPITYFGGYSGLESRKINDNIKTSYCLDNNITLIRIPFTEYSNIENIMRERLGSLKNES